MKHKKNSYVLLCFSEMRDVLTMCFHNICQNFSSHNRVFFSLFLLDNCWVDEAFKIGKNRCVDSSWEGKNNFTWREALREMTVSQRCLNPVLGSTKSLMNIVIGLRASRAWANWQSSKYHSAVLGPVSLTWHFLRGFTF